MPCPYKGFICRKHYLDWYDFCLHCLHKTQKICIRRHYPRIQLVITIVIFLVNINRVNFTYLCLVDGILPFSPTVFVLVLLTIQVRLQNYIHAFSEYQ